jgi:hypothetical protein
VLNTLTLIAVSEHLTHAKKHKAGQSQSPIAACPQGTFPIGLEEKPIRIQPVKHAEESSISEKGGLQLHQPVSVDIWDPSKAREKETHLAEPPPSKAQRILGHVIHALGGNSGNS